MDYKETVLYLKSYKDLHYRLIYINAKLEGVKAISYDDSIGISGTPKTKVDYIAEKEDILQKMEDIKQLIYSIDDYKQRLVLEYKFLQFYSLEQISEIMHYSLSNIQKIYKQGVKKLC